MSTLKELRDRKAAQAVQLNVDANDAREWQRILLKHSPPLRDIFSNFNVAKSWCEESHQLLTLENFESALEDTSPGNLLSRLSLGTPYQVKQEIIDKIAEHLEGRQSPDPAADRYAVAQRKKALSFWQLDRLRQELVSVESATELQGKSPSELRGILHQAKVIPGYPVLPLTIVPRGHGTATGRGKRRRTQAHKASGCRSTRACQFDQDSKLGSQNQSHEDWCLWRKISRLQFLL